MKRTSIFRTIVAIAALVTLGTINGFAREEVKFAHNDHIENGQVVTRDIFKYTDDGKYLNYYKKVDFTYDAENRIASKQVSLWNAETKQWDKAEYYTYEYSFAECCIERSIYENDTLKKSERYVYSNGTIFASVQHSKWCEKDSAWTVILSSTFAPLLITTK